MSSKSSSRSKYSHFSIGFSTSVLKDDFVLAFETDENFDIKSWLPFKGKLKLPTQMEVLKLVLFLRDEAGTNNHGVSAGGIYNSVAEIVQKYWARAGFITKSRIEREVEKIHMEYKKLLKNKTKTTPSFVKARENFLMSENDKGEKIEKLFDVGHSDLEKTLEQDRIRGNLGVRDEDLDFLKDQRGERKSFMAAEDTDYRKKKEAQLKRRIGSAPATVTSSSSQSSQTESLPMDETSSPEADDEDDEDEEMNRRPKRSKFVDVRLPRNIMADPRVTAALDRTNTTPGAAMHVLWDFVKPSSWEFFDILKVKADWLTQPVTEWEESEDYRKARHFVMTVKVVNDAAERGIKLASDYAQSLTKDSEIRQKIFQTVESHRREKPDYKKSTANK